MSKFFIIASFIAFIVTSCKAKNEVLYPEIINIKTIVKSEDVILVDVRKAEDFQKGSAKNAINIPLDKLEENLSKLNGKKVVVFCQKGKQADKAVIELKKKGVGVYDGSTWRNVKAIQEEK